MARYQIPPDPREGDSDAPHARKVAGRAARSSPPWLWIGLGAIVTVLAIAVAVLWARLLLDVKPAETDATPTVILRTAVPTTPPTVVPGGGSEETTPTATAPAGSTSQPAATEEPTPVPPGVIAIGVQVTVAGTGGAGLSLRAGAGTDNARLSWPSDGDVLEVIGGPEEGEGYTWWLLRTADGTEGWAVEDFLEAP